jgi:butyrate kinase
MSDVNDEMVRVLAQNSIALQNAVNQYAQQAAKAIGQSNAILEGNIRIANDMTALKGEITVNFRSMTDAALKMAKALAKKPAPARKPARKKLAKAAGKKKK